MANEKRLFGLTFKPASLKKNSVIFLAVVLGLFWYIYINWTGLNLSPDSSYFLDCALRQHYAGDYFIEAVRAPLYPVLINIFMFFKSTPAEAAAMISGLTYILVLLVFGLILQKMNRNPGQNCLYLLTFFSFDKFAFPLSYAWTEGVFALFILLAFYFALRHSQSFVSRDYIMAAVWVSCAALTRYTGYSLIAVFFLYTLYMMRLNEGNKTISLKYLAWNSISYLPILIYVTHNYIISGTFHGIRPEAKMSVFGNINLALSTLDKDLSFYLSALIIVSIVLFIFLARSPKSREKDRLFFSMSYILLFFFVYCGMIIYTTSTVKVDPIATRYFAPIYPLFFLFIFFAIKSISSISFRGAEGGTLKPSFQSLLKIVMFSFLIAALLNQATGLSKFISQMYKGKYRKNISSFSAGYDINPSSQRIGRYFREKLEVEDIIYVTAVYENPNRVNVPEMASTIFMRKSTLSNPAFRNVSFRDVLPETTEKRAPGFTIAIDMNGRKKSIIFRNLPGKKTNSNFLLHLKQLMERLNLKSLFFIVNDNNKWARIGKKLEEFLPKQLNIQEKLKIGGHFVFRIGYKQNASIN